MLSESDRVALIRAHEEYARALATEILRGLPHFVDREEIFAAAREGLISAAMRFDPTRGLLFSTFAYYRVRGGVFDHVRKVMHTEPRHRARASAEAAADDAVESQLGERPRTATSPADAAADAADALSRVLETAAKSFTVAECAQAMLGDGARNDPEDDASELEAARGVRQAVDALPEKERRLLQAVYFEGTTIEDAGRALGLSKSWASRLHAKALHALKSRVGEFAP